MRKIIFMGIIFVCFSSCITTKLITKHEAYSSFYSQKPTSILVMPPINRSTAVEAKDYFHTTLNSSLVEQGYYVFPPFLSMEMMKRESAYDAELFIEGSLKKFNEFFGADLALFTIIHKWDKSSLMSTVEVEVEYIIKSTITGEVVFYRRGDLIVDTSVNVKGGGAFGLLASMALSAVNTATTKYIDIARRCNTYTFVDLPKGKYHQMYRKDNLQPIGHKSFKVNLGNN